MSAKVVTVFNQKGGCGKTVISMHLAGTLALRGWSVIVLDCDEQGTAGRWASMAPDDAPFPATVTGLSMAGGKVHREARAFAEKFDFMVIDCPPAIQSPVPSSALLISDLALIPSVLAPADMWASVAAKKLVENARAVNETLAARTVPNMVRGRTTVARDLLQSLAEDEDISPTNTHFGLRTAFLDCQFIGATAHRVRGGREAVSETEALADEVLGILGMSLKKGSKERGRK